MRDTFVYRGPDDAGIHVDANVGLGHRRLSIIDLGGGHQPMCDARGVLSIVYNGEVYNYRELRAELVARGHSFRTSSDTEVILQLYADRGEKCVEALNGMFAFAIWDAERRTLFLARDRMGVKPLYYAETPEAFVFASEIKALFASGHVQPDCREERLAEYILFRQVAGSDTLFRGVKSLSPGCTISRNCEHGTRVNRYWSPRQPREPKPITYDDARQHLADLLEESVRLRLISDVPVGTFCSGGLDSSLVTALAARQKGDAINTYSIGFDEPDYDESEYALTVARHCGTMHHQLVLGNLPFNDLLPRMIWHNDEPLDFPNSIHIFALSELAKQRVTVVLTGEGSDELFGGYPRYRIPKLSRRYGAVPSSVRQLISRFTADHRMAKLERFAALPLQDALLYNASYLQPDVVAQLCPRVPPAGLEYRRSCLAATLEGSLDVAARASLLDQETFLVSILHRQDKMSMAASIESRVPFMDYRLVEFANRLPSRFKLRSGAGKALVKDVAKLLLPAEIITRRKSGFGVPLARWFRASDGLGERIEALPGSPGAEVFDRAALRQLVAQHRSGAHDHSELLWTALNVAMWREAFRC